MSARLMSNGHVLATRLISIPMCWSRLTSIANTGRSVVGSLVANLKATYVGSSKDLVSDKCLARNYSDSYCTRGFDNDFSEQ
jgi:hypothetical protein